MNGYIRDVAGEEFSAKDFRAWTGTMLAAQTLRESGPGESERAVKSNLAAAFDQVASQLNNTRAVCRRYYVHPAVVDAYTDGSLNSRFEQGHRGATEAGLEPEESAVLAMLRCYVEMAA